MKYLLFAVLALGGVLAACNSIGGAPGGVNPNPTTAPGGAMSPPPPMPTQVPTGIPSPSPLPSSSPSPGPVSTTSDSRETSW